MDKLLQIKVFVSVADKASFSAVAREFKVTQSAISKAITALEKSLAVRLVNRSTRSVALTEAGRHYSLHCREIIANMDAADAAVRNLNSSATGVLSITAPVPFGLMFISPRVARFKSLYPTLEINLDLNDQPLDLVAENIDVAIRLGHLKTQGWIAKKLGDSPFVSVASPLYLASRGVPEKPADLANHNCIVYRNQDKPLQWAYESNGQRRSINVTSNYASNNLLVLKDAAIASVGIASLPLWMVDNEIKAGMLRPVLSQYKQTAYGIHAVFPSARQLPTKVRLFVDFIKTELSSVSYFLRTRQ